MAATTSTQNPFEQLNSSAQTAQDWLFRVELLRFFRRYTAWFAVAAVPVILVLRLMADFSRLQAVLAGLGLVLLWVAVGFFRALSKRPDKLRALSIWDHQAQRKDLFSSAWFFESERRRENRDLESGEELHVRRAVEAISPETQQLPRILPLPKVDKALGALLVIAIAALTILPTRRIDPGEQLLTGAMQAEADSQSERLRELAAALKKMEESDEAGVDKAELEKLRADVDGAAEDLANTDGLTANDVLAGLEARARAAEKLAEKLGSADIEWASEEMIREMSQHADLADLAVTIKDKNAESASVEADKVAEALNQDELKIETRDRYTTALERTITAATETDKSKPVGERVGNASRKMQDQQSKTAAREFEELAKHFRTVKQREETRKKLEEMANQLRDAGGKISGSKLEKMEQLAGTKNGKQGGGKAGPKGLQAVTQMPMPVPNQPMPQMPQPGQQGAPQMNPGGAQQVPVPGQGQKAPNGNGQKGNQPGIAAPVPGQGQKGKGQKGFAASPSGKGGKGNPGLMAPIPGMTPGGKGPGSMLGQSSAGSGTGPGGGSQSGQPGQGGLEAGQGTAAMGNSPTEAIKAQNDATVVAQTSKSGESTVRAIEGQARTEQAQRNSREVITEFIAVEEQALDGKSLPMSRKEHVLRYFSNIRQQFEAAEKAGGN
ncbi:MAG: hypothetical protein HKN23_22295 [Verrucomicrobiales bacterium]|nr:hypothetical protein [Verrucomicrobiales bacterium]